MNGETEYIHPPDELDDDPAKNGLVCCFDMDRPCGADCMAYTSFESESQTLTIQQKCCVFVVAADRIGRNLGYIAKTIKTSAADAQRGGAKPPPDPMGGT